MTVRTNIIQRTFHIRYNGQSGTCFTLDLDQRRYLITARHIVENINDRDIVEISHGGSWIPIDVALVGHGNGNVDTTVLAPQVRFGANHALNATTAGLLYAEEVYFLGFPFALGFDIGEINADFPAPLAKKALVSAIGLGDAPMLLDGHNNPGFSGGPVVRGWNSEGQTVVGVVSGYRHDTQPIRDSAGTVMPYTYRMNTGIVIAWEIGHVTELVSNNPIGITEWRRYEP